jgi:hypothetical protein
MSDCVERPDAASLRDKKSRPVSSEAAIWISCSLLIAGFVVTHPAMWLYRPNLEGFSKVFTRLPTAIIAIISIAFAPVFLPDTRATHPKVTKSPQDLGCQVVRFGSSSAICPKRRISTANAGLSRATQEYLSKLSASHQYCQRERTMTQTRPRKLLRVEL